VTEGDGQVVPDDLDRDVAAVFLVAREIHARHPTAAQLSPDAIAIGQNLARSAEAALAFASSLNRLATDSSRKGVARSASASNRSSSRWRAGSPRLNSTIRAARSSAGVSSSSSSNRDTSSQSGGRKSDGWPSLVEPESRDDGGVDTELETCGSCHGQRMAGLQTRHVEMDRFRRSISNDLGSES